MTRAVVVRTRGRASNAKREAVRPTPRTVTLAVAARVRAARSVYVSEVVFWAISKKEATGKTTAPIAAILVSF